MVCEVLQDLISSNKRVQRVSCEDAYFVKIVARNPDEEFDGVRCVGYRRFGDVRMTSVMKQLLL
jgi:hypothetical protein